MQKVLTPLNIAKSLTEYWSPKIISAVNDCYIKVAKLKGEFVWHKHEYEDEMFMILQGQLMIEFKDKKIELNAGDIYVVPKGVEHNPVAENECFVLLVENKSTLHTGDIVSQNTKSIQEQLTD